VGAVSLLDRGSHTVYVQRRQTVRDDSGVAIQEPVGLPIPVDCMVQIARDWSSAEETLSAGNQVYDMRVIYARNWPGDEHSHIYYDDRSWEMIGAAQQTTVSKRTRHWRVSVRHIGTAPDIQIGPQPEP
jgi:hypothetical protein